MKQLKVSEKQEKKNMFTVAVVSSVLFHNNPISLTNHKERQFFPKSQ